MVFNVSDDLYLDGKVVYFHRSSDVLNRKVAADLCHKCACAICGKIKLPAPYMCLSGIS